MFTRRTVLNSFVAGASGLLHGGQPLSAAQAPARRFRIWDVHHSSPFGARRQPRSTNGSADPVRRSFRH